MLTPHRPLSECFGRRYPLLAAFLAFTISQLPVIDAKSPITIFILRFLQGFFGAAPSSILSGTLADIWTAKQRGFAMPAVGSFLTIGPMYVKQRVMPSVMFRQMLTLSASYYSLGPLVSASILIAQIVQGTDESNRSDHSL